MGTALAASRTPVTDFIVKLAVPLLAGGGLGALVGTLAWLVAPAYWGFVGLLTRRRVERVARADPTIWALWGTFYGAIGLGLIWIIEYKRLL